MENDAVFVDRVKYRGFKIDLLTDCDAANPRTEWDNLCTMICWHRRYNLGDKHEFADSDEFQAWVKEEEYVPGKSIFLQPLYLYDHSGITISTKPFSDSWDSGQIGWIYLTAHRFKDECARPHNKRLVKIKHITAEDRIRAFTYLENEVETYDQFLTGQVYGYMIDTISSDSIKCNDSCWGYYGPEGLKQAVSEAKEAIDNAYIEYHKQRVAKRCAQAEMDIFMRSCWAW